MFKNNKGFSLVELMISVGVVSIVAFGFMSLQESSEKTKSRAALQTASLEGVETIKKVFDKSSKIIFWSGFDFAKSFYSEDGDINKVTWGMSDLTSIATKSEMRFEVDGRMIYRTSHTLEVINADHTSSVLFSRCIPKTRENTSYTFNEAYNLNRVPFLVEEDGKKRAKCCSINSFNCSSYLDNKNTRYKAVSFLLKKGRLYFYPNVENGKRVESVGFFLNFNKARNPSIYTLDIFSVYDRCLPGSKCKGRYVLKNSAVRGSVSYENIMDTGVLEI